MSARQNKKRSPKSARPEWWERPTFSVYSADRWGNDAKKSRVELILPDATKVDLGYFSAAADSDELRRAVAERFREIWNPIKHCRRSEET